MAFIARVLLAFVFAAVTANAAVDKAQGVAIGHSKDAAQACFGDATPFLLPVSPVEGYIESQGLITNLAG